MELRWLIGRIGATYDRSLGMSCEAQDLLRSAGKEFHRWIPAGYIPEGSGGKGAAAYVPWIAVFDPDETVTARHGMYVVYLFAQDMQTVALSLNQGVTELVERHGTAEGRKLLRDQATAIRNALPAEMIEGLESAIDLRCKAPLPIHYEYGNIVAKTYKLTDLPDENVMVEDLQHFIRLYQEALAVREGIRRTTPGTIVTTVRNPAPVDSKPIEFKPKSATDYVASIAARTLVKSRKHEELVRRYGEFLISLGFSPNTAVHPRDMTVMVNGEEWLIEVKIVRRGDAVSATREAIGQLFSYRYFLYSERLDQVRLLAVFNEDIGDACVGLLESLNIASVWRKGALWAGSETARSAGLC